MKKSTIAKYRNFGKLYQLPERIKRKLHTEPFAKFTDDKSKKIYLNILSKDLALNWIKKIPKAELHYHIGGSMNADMVFNLALNSLWRKYNEWHPNKFRKEAERNSNNRTDNRFEKFKNKAIDKLLPLIKDFQECKEGEEHKVFSNQKMKFMKIIFDDISKKVNDKEFDIEFEKIEFDINPKRVRKAFLKNVQSWITNGFDTDIINDMDLFLVEAFLSIGEPKKWEMEISEIPDEELVFKFLTWAIKKELSNVIKSDDLKEDDVVNMFIVLMGIAEDREFRSTKKFWRIIKDLKKESWTEDFDDVIKRLSESTMDEVDEEFFQCIESELEKRIDFKIPNNTLHNLISAENRRGSLKDYLRGSMFSGSLHLQYYENIVSCMGHLIKEAVDHNIRYLEVRVSPEGYIEKDLTTQEALQALFDGADLMSLYLYKKEKKFIWVNYLVTAKRHKTPEKMAIEISSAITNRERTIRKKEELEKIQNELPKNKLTALGYEWQPSRIVGVDLAGLEKGYKPAQFVEDFAPLFKTCSFLTIHAGEEGSAQNIWEAVYKLNAHRIGHGLTLSKHPFLLALARDTQLCIEMAPISNIFTNPNLINNYPLYDYIKEGLCVTINTDDKAWSNSSLSDEYVKSAELYWRRAKYKNLKDDKDEFLTKWEVLRLIKNGFKKAFLNREEIREFLKAVEEEIYQLVLESEKIEKETLHV